MKALLMLFIKRWEGLFYKEELNFKNNHKEIFEELHVSQNPLLPLNLSFKQDLFSGNIVGGLANFIQDHIDIPQTDLQEYLHKLLFFRGTNWDDRFYKSIDKDERRLVLRNLLLGFLKSRVPSFIMDKIEHENEDNLLALFLSLYYHGGAFAGNAFTETMEKYLQLALRTKIDFSRPVTFKELPLNFHVVASDLSSNRLISFPNDLLNYGYQDKDEKLDNYYLNFPVAEAVRASMSIPFVFQTYILKNPTTGQ
ncbi:MAG: hypothetical protein HRT38_18695 [Alteromonadaceae bacterium]|nr:hypothetical protein [Alteromonadaceae bacterium]